MSTVIQVCEYCAGGCVKDTYAAVIGNVFECTVAAIAIKKIWQSSWLTDVNIVQPVTIDVADGNSVIAVDIHRPGTVQCRTPVVGTVLKLLAERPRHS